MSSKNKRVIWYLLLAILLLAAVFRFWRLDTFPPGLYHDEAYNGLDALSLNQGKTFPQFYEGWELYAADAHAGQPVRETRTPLFFEGNYGREPLHVYLMALSIFLLGATPNAIRAVPAAAGVLAILTTFLAARALFADREDSSSSFLLPLLAAFTMAVLYPAVHFSRFGIRAMVFVPVETMAVACFWWGIKRSGHETMKEFDAGSWFLFLSSGFLLGLAVYTFAASRVLPLVWIFFVPLWFWQERQVVYRYWRYMAGMAGAAFLTAAPLLIFFWRYPYYFVFRIAYVSNKGKGVIEGKPLITWLFNIGRVLRGLLWYGETHLRHNLPGRPYLDLIQAVLFLLGLLNALRRLARLQIQFLLIWFGMMLLPSILSGDAPHFGRLSGAAAPIAILVAVGGVWLTGKLREIFQSRLGFERANSIALALVFLLFAASTIWTAWDYFGRYAQHPELAADFYQGDWQLGQYAREEGEDGSIYLSPTQEELATILFALEDPDQLRNYDGSQGLVPAGIPGTPALYLLRMDDGKSLSALQSYFPEGLLGPVEEGFLPFSIAANAPRNRLENRTDFAFGEQISLVGWTAEREVDQLHVRLAWQANKSMDKNYTAFVHLTDSEGNLLEQLDRPPAGYPTSDWRPGEIVVDSYIIPLGDNLRSGEVLGLSSGFYYLPALEALGETAEIERFTLNDLN